MFYLAQYTLNILICKKYFNIHKTLKSLLALGSDPRTLLMTTHEKCPQPQNAKINNKVFYFFWTLKADQHLNSTFQAFISHKIGSCYRAQCSTELQFPCLLQSSMVRKQLVDFYLFLGNSFPFSFIYF